MYFFFKIFLPIECLQIKYISIKLFSFTFLIDFLLSVQISIVSPYSHSLPTAVSTLYLSNTKLLLDPCIYQEFFITPWIYILSLLQMTFHSCAPSKLKFNPQNSVSSSLKSFLKYILFSQDFATDTGSFNFKT